MAKKAVKSSGKSVAKAAPATGPITLEEAQAAVQAARPALAPKSRAKKAAPPDLSANLGVERRELKRRRNEEIARRSQEYAAVMKLMKKRGARPPASRPQAGPERKSGAAKPVAKTGGFVPLQILAEGDSWFDYPVPFFGGGIIPRLQSRLGVPILNLAAAGDETRFMLGVEQLKKLSANLMNGCPAGGPWDLLLFSGGGNDIVGDPMALWIAPWDAGKTPQQHLLSDRFDAALVLVRAAYENLIALRNQLSPSTHLIFHAYDYAIPDGRGICHLGPWLKPTFDLRGFSSRQAAQSVVKTMIDKFAAMLDSLAQTQKVTFIRTPGRLSPAPSSWHNELHPSRDGFNMFAQLFHDQVKALFPNRVA
jgi:hypothetical protein